MMARNIKIVPAILTNDSATLEIMIRQAESFTNYIQLDIMDGKFVPSQSITWKHLANLPTKLNWEAHLMVLHPEDYLPDFHQAGAQKVIFHYEATPSPLEVIAKARKVGLGVGLAINPETTISTILTLVEEVDNILLMTVNPGFYGSKFIPEVMDKVAELKNARPDVEIGVDGGVKESNITQIAHTGVNAIYVGSAIFLQSQPKESFCRLLALAQES
jgi:ribulose-phosphate 3-epimerase